LPDGDGDDDNATLLSLFRDALLFCGFLRRGFPQRCGRTATGQLSLLLLLLPESEQLGIIVGIGLCLGDARPFERFDATRALKDNWSDEALDLWRLRFRLFLTFLQLQWSPNDVLTNIIIFVQVEELSDFSGSLGTKATWDSGVSQSWDISFSLLDDDEMENGEIGVDDAASDAPAVALTRAARTIALVLGAEQQTNSSISQHSLHHREPLFIVSTADSEDVSLPFVSERIAWNFLRHLLVEKDAKFTIIFDLDEFLASRRRVGNVQLHFSFKPSFFFLKNHLKF